MVECIGVTILFLQKQLVDGQGIHGSPGVLHVLKDWLRDGDGQLYELGPRQGWGRRLVLQGRGQGLRPREIGERCLVLRAVQLGPYCGCSCASCL